ncbi:hypothetical protein STRDD11_00177 [Streptococcus sp. DD11]|nr:hypothetical protein STRDD11_00177 [Streptococcus sp. DD11]
MAEGMLQPLHIAHDGLRQIGQIMAGKVGQGQGLQDFCNVRPYIGALLISRGIGRVVVHIDTRIKQDDRYQSRQKKNQRGSQLPAQKPLQIKHHNHHGQHLQTEAQKGDQTGPEKVFSAGLRQTKPVFQFFYHDTLHSSALA